MTTTTFDLRGTTVLGWLMVRAIARGSGASILAAGVLVGMGVEAKPQIGLVAAVMAVSLIAVGPRSLLRSRWAVRGAAMAVLYFAGNGHAYYLASLYPLLLGLGALPTAGWTMRTSRRTWRLAAAVVLSAAFSALIALPLLPERDLQGSIVIALNSAQGETVGWPRFVQTVAIAWRRIPGEERRHTAIFTGNYGEAGAIDLLTPALHLPRAYSGHNGFSEWGIPPTADTHALLVGFDNAAAAAPYFLHCQTLATVNDRVGLHNQEQGLPVMLCSTTAPWPTLWAHLTHYN